MVVPFVPTKRPFNRERAVEDAPPFSEARRETDRVVKLAAAGVTPPITELLTVPPEIVRLSSIFASVIDVPFHTPVVIVPTEARLDRVVIVVVAIQVGTPPERERMSPFVPAVVVAKLPARFP